MKTLPIHHKSPSDRIGYALVDDELFPYLSQFIWYQSDPRLPSPPKLTLRIEGRPFTLYLNRLIALISISSLGKVQSFTPAEIRASLKNLPPVRFRERDPFNCLKSNLICGPFIFSPKPPPLKTPEPELVELNEPSPIEPPPPSKVSDLLDILKLSQESQKSQKKGD